jgi:hypothetical protein
LAKKNDRLWDAVDALSYSKNATIADDPEFSKIYQPFIVNRALSYHKDSILAANILNERPILNVKDGHDITPALKLQFLFLLNTLRARKRYAKWLKLTDSDDVKAVAEYYGVNLRRARDLTSLHTSDQLAHIRTRLDKGGLALRSSHGRESSTTRSGGDS